MIRRLALLASLLATPVLAQNISALPLAPSVTSADRVICNQGLASPVTRRCTVSSLLSTLTASQVSAALNYTPLNAAQAGVANGIATLGADGKLSTAQAPTVQSAETIVANQAARLSAQFTQTGTRVFQQDTGVDYILTALPATTNANWTTVNSTAGVTQVNGKTGSVSLAFGDLSTGLTGDATTASGSGVMTLATVNSAPGTVGDNSHVASCAVNGKGLTTGCTAVAISPAAIGSMLPDFSNYTGIAATTRATLNAASRTLGDITAISTNTTMSGTPPNSEAGHQLIVQDTMVPTTQHDFINTFNIAVGTHAGHSGQRNTFIVTNNIDGAVADTTGVHNYSAITGVTSLYAPLHPGAAGTANAIGQIFGMNPVGNCTSGASPNGEYVVNCTGGEADVATSGPLDFRSGWQIGGLGNLVQGTFEDCGLCVLGGKFKTGINFSVVDGTTGNVASGVNSVDPTTGIYINAQGAQTAQDGINLNSASLSRHLITGDSGNAQITKTGGNWYLNLKSSNSTVALGSYTSTGTPGITLLSSGNGTPDVSITAFGGTSTANQGAVTTQASAAIFTGTVRGSTDAGQSLGSSSVRWNTVYASNGTIQTSDERKKETVAVDLPRLAAALKDTPTHAYVWRDGSDKGRIRFGVYAQELAWALYKHGLNWQAFSFLQYDKLSDSWGVNYVELQNAKDMLAEAGLLTVH